MRKFATLALICVFAMIPLSANAQNDGLAIEAKSAILIDSVSGKVMFEKDADQQLPIASVTKVMTLDLIFDAVESGVLSLDEKVKISSNAAGMGGSQAFIDAGYEYTASELIKSIIIASANDAAVAMAERLAGSEETFVSKMNKKAQELGMTATVFKNCTGLPEEGHLSTARDVAKMSQELLKHEDYFTWSTTWMDEIRHEKDGRVTELVNTNKLIRSLAGCDGLKTGSTSEAKFCITTTAKRGDMRLISVVLGGSTSALRFEDAAKLINYGFANFENRNVVSAGEKLDVKIPLNKGIEKEIGVTAAQGFSVCVANDGSETVETRVELPENVEAPVIKGQIVGRMIITLDGTEIGSVDLLADNDYKKAGFFDRIKDLIAFWK